MTSTNIEALRELYKKITGAYWKSEPITISDAIEMITEDYTTADPETIRKAITDWLDENPVSGMTDEEKALLNTIITNGDGTKVLADNGEYVNLPEGQTQSEVKHSKYVPTTVGKIGDIVYRKNPVPGMNIGWVYTEFGWLPFGTIANDNSECVNPYTGEPLYDWLHRISPDGNEDFTDHFCWYIDDGVDGVLPKKADLQSHIKKLSDVNGYCSDLLRDGITADTNVFVLGNIPSENDAPVTRTNSICWELFPVTGNVAKDDFKAIVEMDVALLTPTNNTNRPSKGYDVFEALFFESADGHWPYLGMLDDRSNGLLRTSGNIDRNGTEADALYRYLGNFPLNTFVTLKFVVNGMDNISIYIDDCLIDTDLNNPCFKDEEPTEDNMCFFEFKFGDFDYFVCREIRVMNRNPSKLAEITN